MLVAIVFHGYFDVNIEELLGDRKRYACDSFSTYLEAVLGRVGLKNWADQRREKRSDDQLQDRMTYEDVYKTLKRYGIGVIEMS